MAGAGYKLFNTGDVLTAAQVNTYLQEQTVMVFASAAARTTALSGVVAEGMISYLTDTDVVQYYNGTTWTTINTDQTPLTTKGDLFTFSTVDARLAVGNNGETLVADSSASVGLRYQEPKAGNPIVNSAFQVWQRGTSLAISNGVTTYLADRWAAYRGATGSTVSRQTTSDTTNLPNIQYCARVQRDSGNTSTSLISYYNIFESVNSIPFAGKTVTFSFYARAGANYSQASSGLTVVLKTGTGTDQNVYSGFTGASNAILQTATLTTTWQRFSYTATLATTATQIATGFEFTPVGTAGAADYFEITGVQLEVGSVATPFKTQGVTLAGELAACQRYYFRATASSLGARFGNLSCDSTTVTEGTIPFPVQMRIAPTALETSGTAGDYSVRSNGTTITASVVPSFLNANTFNASVNVSVASGLTAGNAGTFRPVNSNAYLGWSAEL